MICAIIGSGGSGKSLYFIRYLFKEVDVYEIQVVDGKEVEVKVVKPIHRLYKRLILNIKGFSEEKFRELSGNFDIEIVHESKHWNKDDIQRIFKDQEKEDDKPETDRVPTLFIYDECQFGLSTFSQAQALLAQNEYIANFMSLHRHYGPCDIFLATQSADKIHNKFVGDLDELYISLESSQKMDPENDIVFDQYDKDGKSIISGGRSKIKFQKLDKLTAANGEKFLPFDLYTSGDAGRRPVKRKSYWGKYIYIFIALIIFIVIALVSVFYSMFSKMGESSLPVNQSIPAQISADKSTPGQTPRRPNYRDSNSTNEKKDISSDFEKYIETPYHNIDAQILYRIFISNNQCFIGKQVIPYRNLKKMLADNVIYEVSTQRITKNSLYINVLIHQSLLNTFQLINDFDNSAESNVNSKSHSFM